MDCRQLNLRLLMIPSRSRNRFELVVNSAPLEGRYESPALVIPPCRMQLASSDGSHKHDGYTPGKNPG